jgi:glycine cleavage system H protein
MEVRDNLKYTEDHEWISIKGTVVTLGITDYAQDSLSDIVYVELPEVGTIVEAGEVIGNIESVKAVAELYSPVGGEVIEVNKELEDQPDLVNTDPYDDGWMLKIQLEAGVFDEASLMNEEAYEVYVSKLKNN